MPLALLFFPAPILTLETTAGLGIAAHFNTAIVIDDNQCFVLLASVKAIYLFCSHF